MVSLSWITKHFKKMILTTDSVVDIVFFEMLTTEKSATGPQFNRHKNITKVQFDFFIITFWCEVVSRWFLWCFLMLLNRGPGFSWKKGNLNLKIRFYQVFRSIWNTVLLSSKLSGGKSTETIALTGFVHCCKFSVYVFTVKR